VQVAVPLVQVALVGAVVQPLPTLVIDALVNDPLVIVIVAVAPVQPLNPVSRSVPVPENPLPPLIPVTVPRY
jgi:hypothetical protein